MTYNRKRPALDYCPVEAVLAIVSGKWKVRVLYLLSLDDLTFSEIRYLCRRRQPAGFVFRAEGIHREWRSSPFRTVSPRQIRYGLTAKGRELVALLMPLAAWGSKLLSQSGANWKPPEIQRRPQREDRRLGALPG